MVGAGYVVLGMVTFSSVALFSTLMPTSFVVLKVIIGINLVHYAVGRRAGMEAHEKEDAVNDFGRDPVGEGPEERVRGCELPGLRDTTAPFQLYNRELKFMLDDARDDAAPISDMGEKDVTARPQKATGGGGGGSSKKRPKLEDITRFTMVKRIW
jgi:hypothetical protein